MALDSSGAANQRQRQFNGHALHSTVLAHPHRPPSASPMPPTKHRNAQEVRAQGEAQAGGYDELQIPTAAGRLRARVRRRGGGSDGARLAGSGCTHPPRSLRACSRRDAAAAPLWFRSRRASSRAASRGLSWLNCLLAFARATDLTGTIQTSGSCCQAGRHSRCAALHTQALTFQKAESLVLRGELKAWG